MFQYYVDCIGVVSWHSELTTDAELSSATDNREVGINWITEPMSGYRNTTTMESDASNTNWADFSSAFPTNTSSAE